MADAPKKDKKKKKGKDKGKKGNEAKPEPEPDPAPAPLPAPVPEPTREEAAPLADTDPSFASVRFSHLRQHLKETGAEERLASCVQKLLGAEELPWNPYPTLTRLLRREEMLMSLSLSKDSAVSGPSLWRESQLHVTEHSALDSHLARLPEVGAGWRALTPMLDNASLRAAVGGLAASELLKADSKTADVSGQRFAVKSGCSLSGDHMFAGRLVRYPCGIDLYEHVQARRQPPAVPSSFAPAHSTVRSTAPPSHGTLKSTALPRRVPLSSPPRACAGPRPGVPA